MTRLPYVDLSGLPAWITQEHIEACMDDIDLQDNWEPRVGDWYFCIDLYQVMQIFDLDQYWSEGRATLPSGHSKDDWGHWTCDTYLPEPK